MSALSQGRGAGLKAGDRLPWVKFPNGKDNFQGLDGLNWIVQIYGDGFLELRNHCVKRGLAFESLLCTPEAEKSGLVKDCFYLLRPDGYIALIGREAGPGELESYLAGLELVI
jgi:hypothetical protein